MVDVSQHIIPSSTEFCLLECKTAFELLTDKERRYAHYLSMASWYGGLIVLYQTSPESPGIYLLLSRLMRHGSLEELHQAALSAGLSDEEYKDFLVYVAAFLSNTGNYKSFGDSKIIPSLSRDRFEALVLSSAAYKHEPDVVSSLWSRVAGAMYSLSKQEAQLGLGDSGITTYFSSNCTLQDASLAKEFLQSKDLSAYNTRLFKNSSTEFVVRLASSLTSGEELAVLGTHEFMASDNQSYKFTVARGDYSPLLQLVNENLVKAKAYCSNETEVAMLEFYIKSFTTGSIEAHKDGSRQWIKDKGPVVESYIGFIESYRDPVGARGEFEGFVAMVNKDMSAKFTQLVTNAESYLPLLPWPPVFEKDKFLQPDFTSLDVLTFAGSGIPAGINIPNYDDIRQSEGFKNVSLGNVLSSSYKGEKNITFLSESDKDLYAKLKAASFEVQVGLHELLGHGSGKLFQKNPDGSFNFDTSSAINVLTGEPIASWYETGETFYSKFPVICSSYEECRAECVGLLLCLNHDILRVFGYGEDVADDIIYVNWLNMARAGLLGLEYYSPETDSWRQAHMQARYVILQVLLEAGGLVTIETCTGSDGKPDLVLSVDRSKIDTVGRKAISNFLLKLQVYKATADFVSARDMYNGYSALIDSDALHFTEWRQIVLSRRVPRKMMVQCNTTALGDSIQLVDYEASAEGLIKSFVDRFPNPDSLDAVLEQLWMDDLHYWQRQDS